MASQALQNSKVWWPVDCLYCKMGVKVSQLQISDDRLLHNIFQCRLIWYEKQDSVLGEILIRFFLFWSSWGDVREWQSLHSLPSGTFYNRSVPWNFHDRGSTSICCKVRLTSSPMEHCPKWGILSSWWKRQVYMYQETRRFWAFGRRFSGGNLC